MEKGQRRILISQDEIKRRVTELGGELSEDYKDQKPLVIGILRGGFIFTADLVRAMDITLEVDFLTTSSYNHGFESTGNVNILQDVRTQVRERDVILVDDIMDSGNTLKVVKERLLAAGANSVKICVMLDKPERRTESITPDYVAFEIPDVFIVGCGLDYGDYYRNVPYIYTYE
ncbi:MAG: hypoxanthine phosphoribosyltransferase [Tissierellia bacterium]|nr:hypoxanthine phosphoribosyltransferase [Tissierellia bacterium]